MFGHCIGLNDDDGGDDDNDDDDDGQVMVPGEWGEEACGLPIQQVFLSSKMSSSSSSVSSSKVSKV